MADTGIHLYHMTAWQGADQQWHCNDIKHMSGRSAKWYTPMRILGLSIEDYIKCLLQFHAVNISYYEPTDYLRFNFNTEREAKAFCNYINKAATKYQYYCS